MNDIHAIECGCVAAPSGRHAVEGRPWNAHPAFAGVSLKDLVLGADTQGRFSCHLVRVEPGCVLKDHAHPEQTELHQVAAGAAVCIVDGNELAYRPGEMAVMPQGVRHSVTAGPRGVTLVATFSPPLK
ncbi:cupin domain-containing protein [Desulfocurvus sp. DL9XJH121]